MKSPKRPGGGNHDLFNDVLAGASPEAREKLLRILYHSGINEGDPIFLILAALTNCQMSVEPIPEELASLREGIKAVLLALCEEVEISLHRHEELNHSFYVTAERLSTILNQKLSEVERHQNRHKSAISLSLKTALLWCLITSAIGGIAGALLIATVMIVAAAH